LLLSHLVGKKKISIGKWEHLNWGSSPGITPYGSSAGADLSKYT